MKLLVLLFFFCIAKAFPQQTIDKLNSNQLKLPKESVNRALTLDASGQIKSSSTVSDTELSYLDGLTDTLLNLLSGKANDADVVKLTPNQSVNGTKTFIGKLVASTTVNGSIPCPVMTETQRNAFTPVRGDCVYNSTSLKLNVYDGSIWKDAGGSGGVSLWTTATPYIVNDVVIESDRIYRCIVAHTSGTFATDLAASRWVEVSSSPATPYSLANGGTNKALTASNGGVVWVDADSFEILAPGTSGQILQSNAAASPSWVNKSISGKTDVSASVTLEEIQVPNNQLTTTATNKHKIETGNTNILVNPSFEHSTFSTGWTNSAGTFTEETALEIDGLKAAKLVLSSQIMSLTQSSTLYASQFADGVQGLAMVRVKSNVALKVCAIQAGTVSTSLCVDVPSHNKWGLFKIPFILGATSSGISVASTGAVSGTVYVDDAYVGATNIAADVDQSRVAGESFFAGTAGCTWSRTNTAIGAFGSTAACPGPTIVYSSIGQWQTTDSDLPRQTINNLPAGVYKAKFITTTTGSALVNGALAINDGSSTCNSVFASGNNTFGIGQIVECVFVYTSPGNRVFELFGASSGSSFIASNTNGPPSLNTKFILEYFGSGSVYSASCGAACEDTLSAKVSSAGVVSDENQDWINGNCVVTITSLFTCTYTSGIFTVAPNCTVTPAESGVGTFARFQGNPTNTAVAVFTQTNSTADASEFNIICTKTGADYRAGRTIVGSFNEVVTTPGVTKPVFFSVTYGTSGATCSASPCAIDAIGTVASVTRSGVGSYAINFPLYSKVKCVPNATSSNITTTDAFMTCNSCTSLAFQTKRSDTGASQDTWGTVLCHGVIP
jgi:hypothetical protein